MLFLNDRTRTILSEAFDNNDDSPEDLFTARALFMDDWQRKAISDAFDDNYDPPEDPIAAEIYDMEFDREAERQDAWEMLADQGWGLGKQEVLCPIDA